LAVYESPTEPRVEKFLKKLAGRTDLEDAVKRLDKLTQEEARMALAEVLRITHSVHDEVKVVDGKVADVGDKVQSVDQRVQIVMDGARALPSQSQIPSNLYTSRRQAGKSSSEGNQINYPTDGKQRRRH